MQGSEIDTSSLSLVSHAARDPLDENNCGAEVLKLPPRGLCPRQDVSRWDDGPGGLL